MNIQVAGNKDTNTPLLQTLSSFNSAYRNLETQTADTEAIWNLTREGGTDNASIGDRGSFTDEENAGVENIVKGIKEGSNKRRILVTERK